MESQLQSKGYDILLQVPASEYTQSISQGLLQCALLLKQLSHPHVVKFFTFHDSKDGDYVLVMERLDCNLRDYLERHTGKLSCDRQIDICLQISDAVHYLHSQQPPVVYRFLSANNVLLSHDGVLKLGSCMQAARMPSCGYFDEMQPGAVMYLPPEAVVENAHYNEKIDIFSFGVLMLEIATQHLSSVWSSGLGTVLEIDRRAEDLSLLPEDHPLKPIILQCLRDAPGERPDSGAVFRMLSEGKTLIWLVSACCMPQRATCAIQVCTWWMQDSLLLPGIT